MVQLVIRALKLPPDVYLRGIEGHVGPGKPKCFAPPQAKDEDQHEGSINGVMPEGIRVRWGGTVPAGGYCAARSRICLRQPKWWTARLLLSAIGTWSVSWGSTRRVKVRDFDGNVLMDGLAAMRGQYGPLFRDSPGLSVEIPRRVAAGDYVVDEEQVSGFVLAGYPAAMHAVVVYRVRDGLIHDVVFLI
jgi:hypothetical protein